MSDISDVLVMGVEHLMKTKPIPSHKREKLRESLETPAGFGMKRAVFQPATGQPVTVHACKATQ